MYMSDSNSNIPLSHSSERAQGVDEEIVFVKLNSNLLITAAIMAGAATIARSIKGGPLVKVGTFAGALALGQIGHNVGK